MTSRVSPGRKPGLLVYNLVWRIIFSRISMWREGASSGPKFSYSPARANCQRKEAGAEKPVLRSQYVEKLIPLTRMPENNFLTRKNNLTNEQCLSLGDGRLLLAAIEVLQLGSPIETVICQGDLMVAIWRGL